MGSGSGFPIDLILFGMIAAFLVLRLRSILGKRTGYERPPQQAFPPTGPRAPAGPVIDGRAEPIPVPPVASDRTLPDPGTSIGQALARMRGVDPSFDPGRFLAGAEQAFRMIVAAFATGDRDTLRNLLSEDTFRAFDGALTTRQAAGETQKTEIRTITSETIESASLLNSIATITTRFVSDQVNVTNGRDGNPVAGADALMEITDIWTFERDLASRDPTWRLIAARNA